MRDEVLSALPRADVLVFAAAVCDFKPRDTSEQKLKRGQKEEGLEIDLTPTPDIARATIGKRKPGTLAVGFALETEDILSNARKKLKEKEFQLIVANSALEEGAGFDVPTNRVTILDTEGGIEELPVLPKEEVAEKILDRLSHLLEDGR